MLVRILIGAGLFVLGYALGRATRPVVPTPVEHRSRRISDVLSAQEEERPPGEDAARENNQD